ncbi:MAG: O-antigen ligase family protein, partial [Anaerolineae bacterium]|nr:O-antigen ligase family protein [Anaerolineae bacterium]
KDNYVGYLYPTIDDQSDLANALPQDNAGNPYIILTSGSLLPETSSVLIANHLNQGHHTLTAVAHRGYDRYALAGYAVSSGDLATPYNTQIALGWLAVVISLAGVVITGWQVHWRKFLRPLAGFWQQLSTIAQFSLSALASLLLMLGMLLTWGEASPTLFRREPVQIGLSILTAGLIYLNPALPLTLIAAFVLFIILYHRPAFGLALIIFFAPFFLFPVELYRFAFPMSELLTLITFAAWLVRTAVQWAQPEFKLKTRWQPLDIVLLVWVLLGVISLLWTQNRAPAITELRTLLIEPALFYLIFRTLPLTRQDVLRVVDALLCAGLIVCLVGLYLYVRGEAVITAEEDARRLASIYGSPNNVALFLGRCLPFTLAFTLIPIDRNRRILAGICFGLMLLTVILTQSVGALFIGVPAAVAAVLLVIYRRRALIPMIILIGLAVVGFIIGASLSERFARALDFTEGTNFARLRVWQSAFNILQDHPITGLGLDQFLYSFRGQYILPDAWQEPDLSHPHNFLLDIWIRLGLIGIMLFAAMQCFFWQQNLQNLRRTVHDPLLFALTAGIIGSMVNLLAHGLIDNSLFVLDLAFVFMLLLALTAALSSSNIRSIDVTGDKMV